MLEIWRIVYRPPVAYSLAGLGAEDNKSSEDAAGVCRSRSNTFWGIRTCLPE